MLLGTNKYWLKVVNKSVLWLCVVWLLSGSFAEVLVIDYQEEKFRNEVIWLATLKYCMKTYQGKSGNLGKMDSFIKLPQEVMDKKAQVKFSQMQNPTANLKIYFFCFFDQCMIIDLKYTTKKYEVEDDADLAAFHFDEEQLDDELENDQLEQIQKLRLDARIITQMSPWEVFWP